MKEWMNEKKVWVIVCFWIRTCSFLFCQFPLSSMLPQNSHQPGRVKASVSFLRDTWSYCIPHLFEFLMLHHTAGEHSRRKTLSTLFCIQERRDIPQRAQRNLALLDLNMNMTQHGLSNHGQSVWKEAHYVTVDVISLFITLPYYPNLIPVISTQVWIQTKSLVLYTHTVMYLLKTHNPI